MAAENFDPEYIKINPNGTVPSLTSAHLDAPLTDSRAILEHLDQLHHDTNSLSSGDPVVQAKVEEIIGIVHDDQVSTNLILLQARDKEELESKRASMWKSFVGNRQAQLEKHQAQLPEHTFYPSKLKDNTPLQDLYTSEAVDGPQVEDFFRSTHDGYRDFAAGLGRLNTAIVLPHVAGKQLTYADLHVVPWLAHAMVRDLGLEALVVSEVC